MSDETHFTDASSIDSMEAEHLPLWRAFLRIFAPFLHPQIRILDFGCSRGGLLSLVARETAAQAGSGFPSLGVGIDVDTPAMRAQLARAAESARGLYPLLYSTGSPRDFPGQFDLVISHEVVYLVPDLKQAFDDIFTSLVPGGRFCFATGCHSDNPLFPRWRTSLGALGVELHERSSAEYEAALQVSGFVHIRRDRLALTLDEYEAWIRDRGSIAPNPKWFPSPSAERRYYTQVGKLVLTAQKGEAAHG